MFLIPREGDREQQLTKIEGRLQYQSTAGMEHLCSENLIYFIRKQLQIFKKITWFDIYRKINF